MGRDKRYVEVMRLTGCKYQTAMREHDRRVLRGEVEVWWSMLRALPARAETDPARCVTCLAPLSPTRCPCGGTGRA